MQIKYSNHFLNKLEDILAETDYMLRYEKGNFKSGYCILNENKVVIINKYFPLEGKINALIDILSELKFNPNDFKNKSKIITKKPCILKYF